MVYTYYVYIADRKKAILTVSVCLRVLSCRSDRPRKTAGKLLIEAFSAPPRSQAHLDGGIKSDRRGFEGSIQAQRKMNSSPVVAERAAIAVLWVPLRMI